MEEGTKEFYNQQINELHKIIANYEQIVKDYVALVSSMQVDTKRIQDENAVYYHRLRTADDYLESRKENLCIDHYDDLKYIVNECDLESTW